MRAARYVIPFAIVAALVAGCDSKGKGGTVTPTTPAAVLTDNGVAAMTAQQILEKAMTALKAAKSVHIKGDIKTDDGVISLDLTLTDTKDGVGTMSMAGQKVELTKIGTDIYMKADAEFWKQFAGDQGGVIATLLAGKYLKATTSDGEFGSMGALGPGERAWMTLVPPGPGDYALLCFVPDETGMPHLGDGMVVPFTLEG